MGPPLHLRSRIAEITDKKVIVTTDLLVEGTITARGKVVAVRIPEHLVPEKE
jgi:hypothetical protein